MDGYQFIAAIVQSIVSLGWPIALVVCVLLFRERLKTLLPLLRMKYKDWDVSFRLDKAEEEAAALPPGPIDLPTQATPEEKTRFEKLAEISPRAAIADLRTELEHAVIASATQHGFQEDSAGRILTFMTATRLLRNNNVIDAGTSASLDDLRSIGNSATHATEDVSREDALRYRALADIVIRRLTQ